MPDMSLSRREFLAAGAAAAAVGSASTAGMVASASAAGAAGDVFSSSANFKPYVNTPFKFQTGPGKTSTTMLIHVDDFRAPSAGSSTTKTPTGPGFYLTFDGSGLAGVHQGTYIVKHASLGTFPMFIGPYGKRRNFQAVINRLH